MVKHFPKANSGFPSPFDSKVTVILARETITLTSDAWRPVVGDSVPVTDADNLVVGDSTQRHCHTTTRAGSLLTEDVILSTNIGCIVTEDTAPTMIIDNSVARATTLTTSSNGLITGPPTPVISMLSHWLYGLFIKKFTCHTKHLKIFY